MGIFNNNQQLPENGNRGTDKVPSFIYRCIEACTYGGRFYAEGEIMVLPEKKEVPHFKFVEEKAKEE